MTGRIPVSGRCDAQVWERARATAQGMLAHDPTYTVARLLEDALAAEASRLEDAYNQGRPWPTPQNLRQGRRAS